MRAAGMLFCAAALLLVSGCSGMPVVGLVYTHVRAPLTPNLHATPLPEGAVPVDGSILEFSEPFSGLGMTTRVQSNAIGDISRAHGIQQPFFADQEVFSILGIWTRSKALIYGR
jgi:hypothetical protein